MGVRTCLLVSDDPDDHIEFTEALSEISDDIIVLIIPDVRRAADLVLSKRHIPDYLIVDLAMSGFSHDDFFSTLRSDKDFSEIVILAYGDQTDYERVTTKCISAFLERDSTYSDLRTLLRKVV
jgi:response regulator RpfG family c-di-GMP phosphodiesterase